MDNKSSELDVFLNMEEEELPPSSERENIELKHLKLLLLTPAPNRRAIRSYIRQNSSLQKGEKVKKAA